MRKILFRGFTPDAEGKDKAFVNGEWIKGQWVQGSYMKLDKTTYCFKEDYDARPDNTEHYIVFDQMTDWGLPNRHLQADVIPETVGQYTGLIDKNGKEIFEGDIVKDGCLFGKVVYATAQEGYEGMAGFMVDDVNDGLQNYNGFWHQVEVVGNIHDNPELLEGSAG